MLDYPQCCEYAHDMNKTKYNNGDRVQVAIYGDVSHIITGTIVGLAVDHILDFWLVQTDERIDSNYPFDVASIQNTFIRKIGDNRPFLCELGKLSHD